MLRDNLKNVDNINFIIRDPRSLPPNGEITREFDLSPHETLFNTYDIMEKNKLHHFEQARTMGERDKEVLLNRLPGDFYKLLGCLTISRSRKHITGFYGTREVGKFPERLKPDTYIPHIDAGGELLNFKETNMRLEELILAVYMPMKYIQPAYRAMYRERYQTRYNNKIIFSHEDREFYTARPENDSSLYPYYLIFMDRDGAVLYGNTQARGLLKLYRKLCYGKSQPIGPLVEKFLEETCHVREMGACSQLLTHAVGAIQGEEEQAAEESIFDFSGYNNPFAGNTVDDFELISFLVVD